MTIIDLFEKRKEQNNRATSAAMAVDLLNDVMKDLQTFENMEEIQEAIRFLRFTKNNITSPES